MFSGRKPADVPTVIGANLTVTGTMASDGSVLLDGTVDGDVQGRELNITNNGRVTGSVTAERAVIHGRVDGELRVQELLLTATAEVTGTIFHDRITVEPGARIDGHCRPLSASGAATDATDDGPVSLVVSDGVPAKTPAKSRG